MRTTTPSHIYSIPESDARVGEYIMPAVDNEVPIPAACDKDKTAQDNFISIPVATRVTALYRGARDCLTPEDARETAGLFISIPYLLGALLAHALGAVGPRRSVAETCFPQVRKTRNTNRLFQSDENEPVVTRAKRSCFSRL